jgi:tryptophanase
MTPRQIDLARHALGLPNNQRVSYRNRFVAGKGHFDYEDWCAMVQAKDAIVAAGEHLLMGSDDYFYLTLQGAKKAILPGESLDREDFPAAVA